MADPAQPVIQGSALQKTAAGSQFASSSSLLKVKTGVEGFDEIAHGGIPQGRSTLISGTSGSGKTIFSMQFLVAGIEIYAENGVFVTFEEIPDDIIKNMLGFGWDLSRYLKEGKFAFVDASPSEDESVEVGEFDLGAFLARLLHAVEKVGAKRMAIDSISALFPRYTDQAKIRRELYRIAAKLKKIGITTLITAEKIGEAEGRVGRFGVEEFVSDNVILLHNCLDEEHRDRRRSIEILKFRGTSHETQDTPLLVRSDGINVFPRPKPSYAGQKSSTVKITTGIGQLDQMLFGGYYEDSVTLISGPSGVGKTVLALQFMVEGARKGENGLFFAFEESQEQLYRNAESFGWQLRELVKEGKVKLICSVPEELKAEEHYKRIKDIVEAAHVKRFVIDSLSALERIYAPNKFREFVIGLNVYLKNKGVTSLITDTISTLLDVSEITESNLSTMADNVILIKYVEVEGKIKRALAVIKARASEHDKQLHELVIDNKGISLGKGFLGLENLMGGSAKRIEGFKNPE